MTWVTLTFIQLSPFVADCRRLRITDEDLQRLELMILENPEIGRVIPGTGGLRKVRFSLSASGRGKSGGIRVGYALMRFADSVYFTAAFAKNEKANFSPRERSGIRKLIQSIERKLREKKP